MMAECGFEKQAAVVAVGALVAKTNEKFGDCIDVSACLAGLRQFFNSGVEMKCGSCGWRKPGTKFCTQAAGVTSDGNTCDVFRHLFVVEAK